MIREAELEDMEKQWKAQNAAIMAATPPVAENTSEQLDIATGPPADLMSGIDRPQADQPANTPEPPVEPELPLGKSADTD